MVTELVTELLAVLAAEFSTDESGVLSVSLCGRRATVAPARTAETASRSAVTDCLLVLLVLKHHFLQYMSVMHDLCPHFWQPRH